MDNFGSLATHSKFYFGWEVTQQSKYIDFNDGSDKVAELKIGKYSTSQLATEIKKKMDAVSTLDFTVSFDRTTRKFTISSTSNFNLLVTSGVNVGQSAYSVIGFTGPDKTGASSYLADNISGYEYSTQFFLQSYKDPSTNRKAIDGTINKSSSGQIEVIKFGNERFMECELNFITNLIQESGSIVRSNESGIEDYIRFIEWCTEKAHIEFMKNEDDVASYNEYILESTDSDSKGLDYDLIETYDKGLPFYYRSGKLKFRLIS